MNPLQVPQQGPYGERYLLTGHFYISLNISHFFFPSESPIREPPPCCLTGSPWAGILHHQSHWPFYSFIHVCLSVGVPKRSPPTYGEKQGHHKQSPTQTEGLRTVGCGLVPQVCLAVQFWCALCYYPLLFSWQIISSKTLIVASNLSVSFYHLIQQTV